MSRTPKEITDALAAELIRDVDAGLRQLDESNAAPLDEAAVERIKRRGREKLRMARGLP